MKFLLTGMTAQQANPESHLRAANYAGYLRKVLETGGHEVDWTDPEIDADLGDYDYVIVGVAPITSLGANRAYGALSIIERLWDSKKLTILVDAPEPGKIDNSLQAIVDKPSNLTKEFFSYRKGFTEANDPVTRERLLKVVSWLHEKGWPRTLVPALPWHTAESMITQIPRGARQYSNGGDLESFVIADWLSEPVALDQERWSYQASSDKKWLARQGTTWDTIAVPWSSRAPIDSQAASTMCSTAGTLIAPERTGTWWNTRYAMSVALGVPVFTEWRESSTIGTAWATLPMVYESIDPEMRRYVARMQLEEYQNAIDDQSVVVKEFDRILMGDE
jgi:hypothetical protein